MGRIKTQLIKRLTFQLVRKHEYTQDFNENKALIADQLSHSSKKIRNQVAGYVTRLMKNKEDFQ